MRRRASTRETIRRLAADLAAAERPVLYSRIGACTQEFGTLATWLVFVLNAALGAVDRLGGALFAKPAVWSPMFMKPPDQTADGWEFGRFHSRVRGAPEVLGQFPIGCLAEEIDTPGEGRVRALISVAGNPVDIGAGIPPPGRGATATGRDDLHRQLAQRDDPACERHPARPLAARASRTPTICTGCTRSRRASSGPSRCSLPVPIARGSGSCSCAWPAPRSERRSPTSTCAAMDDLYVQGLIATMCATAGTPLTGHDADAAFASSGRSGPERLVDLGIRLGPWGDGLGRRPGGLTLEEVRAAPDGLWLADLEEGDSTTR